MLEFRKDQKGTYSFVVKSDQGHPLLESIGFTNREEARQQAEALEPLVRNPSSFERTTEHSGTFRFALKGKDGRVIGKSLRYQSEAGMENGIKNTVSGIADWHSKR